MMGRESQGAIFVREWDARSQFKSPVAHQDEIPRGAGIFPSSHRFSSWCRRGDLPASASAITPSAFAARLRADALGKLALFLPMRSVPEAGSNPRTGNRCGMKIG